MAKGLPRSLSRGDPREQELVKQSIRMENLAVSMTDPGSATGWGTAVISGLPEGFVLLLGASIQFEAAHSGDGNITDTFDGDFAVGSSPTSDNTLDSGEADVISSTATVTASGGTSTGNSGVSTSSEMGVFDNTDGSLELNLNVLLDDGSINGAEDLVVNGVLHVAYTVIGDD